MSKIIVNKSLCNKCNTCGTVCVMGIIEKANDSHYPIVLEVNKGNCLKCGHCESYCPQQALILDFLTEEKIQMSPFDGQIDSNNISLYIKKRRSVRHFSSKPVPKELIAKIIDVARYAASGGNSQTVQWLVIHDSSEVNYIAGLTIEWMRQIRKTSHPFAPYVQPLITAWESGTDLICRNAPHLVFVHIPKSQPIEDHTDAIIALTHFDIAAPSFSIGTCWAGFVKAAMDSYKPLQDALGLAEGRKAIYGLMFGYPRFKVTSIPRRNPVNIIWK